MNKQKIASFIFIFLIVSLGLFLRVYNIENVPPGIYPDEAMNGEDAIRANDTGNYQWFYQYNTGREGLFMNMIAFCFKFFGISILTLKLPAILASTLTIWGIYLLTKELFGKEKMALVAAFLTAVSFWSINFARISFRANLLPLILSFSFYFLFRGLRTKKILDFSIGGFIFGLGLHTYIAFRIAPLILLISLIALIISKEYFLKKYWKQIITFVIFTTIAASPMLYTFYVHPEYIEARDSVSIFSPQINKGNLTLIFLRSFSLSLIKYNFVGDMNWRHNYRPYPLLDILSGVVFLFGIIQIMIKFSHSIRLRFTTKTKDEGLYIYTFLLIWFFAMLAPEFLTAEGNPHALRSIGTLPVVFIFSAFGANLLWEKANKKYPQKRAMLLWATLTLIVSVGLFNGIKYHYFWANKPIVAKSFDKNITDISKYIQTLPSSDEKIVITSFNRLERLPIYVFNLKNNVSYFYPDELGKISPKNTTNLKIFLTENNQNVIAELRKRFPQLKITRIDNTLESVYYILK